MSKKIKKQFKTQNVRVFKQFQKQKIFKQITFVIAAFVMAFWINTFVLNWEYGNNLKTNLLENNKNISVKSDIYIEKENNIAKIKVWKKMDNVKSISFIFLFFLSNKK